jgi:hypothetical protein
MKSHYCRPLLSRTALPPPLLYSIFDDDYVLARDVTCVTSADTTSVTTHHHIRVIRTDVRDAPPDLGSDQYFALSRLSGVHQVEEVYVLVYDTAAMLFGGIAVIDPRVMSMFDPHAPNSALSRYDDL